MSKFRERSEEFNSAEKKSAHLEERLDQERKSNRMASIEIEALVQQKCIKIEELTTTIEGKERLCNELCCIIAMLKVGSNELVCVYMHPIPNSYEI